jgi:hypothetical protein
MAVMSVDTYSQNSFDTSSRIVSRSITSLVTYFERAFHSLLVHLRLNYTHSGFVKFKAENKGMQLTSY